MVIATVTIISLLILAAFMYQWSADLGRKVTA